MAKWVYLFGEGHKGMRDLLGGKGVGLAEMTRTEIPVPPGFTISTASCKAYFDAGRRLPESLLDQACQALKQVEEAWDKHLGNRDERSATGVAFTRDPATGGKVLYGEYLMHAQGEDGVAGIRTEDGDGISAQLLLQDPGRGLNQVGHGMSQAGF